MEFNESKIIEVVDKAWGWKIPNVDKVLAVNSMGNVLLLDQTGAYWRICPEELSAKIAANDHIQVQELFADPEFKADWQFLDLINEAESVFGSLKIGECYALNKPAVIGGEYSTKNMRVVSLYRYLADAGEIAHQAKDLKQGEKIMISMNGSTIELCKAN